jgi:predicted amidohydrolase YtcJ
MEFSVRRTAKPVYRSRFTSMICLTGRVWTGDSRQPWAEAIAVAGNRIVAVGARDDVRAAAAGARVVDAGPGLIVPGFVDAHIHLLAGGLRLTSVQLRDASSPQDLAGRLSDFAATVPAGTWITGGDWDHQRWGGELPARDWIDAATRSHPVWVNRLDGHMALANSVALSIAGVTRHTAEVAGGAILRDADGDPTGLLNDHAMELVARAVPAPATAIEDRALEAAMRHIASHGVTSVHHMGSIPQAGSWRELDALRRARAAGALRTRIYCAVPLHDWARLRDLIAAGDVGGPDGRGDPWLKIGALKGFVDGSLGSRTAAFHEPYADAPGNRGLLVTEPADLLEWIAAGDAAGLHCVIHAIGDRANTLLLDTFEQVIARHGRRDRRFRVEHAQHLRPQDVARLAAAGAIASMQPLHLVEDGVWAESAIGPDRARMTYACRSLLDAGARVAFGSDWFVAPPVPLAALAAAVTRQTIDGQRPHGWIPEQRLTLEEALRAHTCDAAYASFDEHLKGRILPGLLADLVVLDRDPFALPPDRIASCRVAMTIVNGEIVYQG